MSERKIRCKVCGKFIGNNEIPDKVIIKFTPDTQFTVENTEFTHKKCELCQKEK